MHKTKFYTEVPTAYLDLLDPYIDGHFCIATECLKDPAYYDWYINNGLHVMLDNGMFEEGKPMATQDLLEVFFAVHPDVVFAPDQVGDKKLTLEMAAEFTARLPGLEDRIGYIPQGENYSEVVDCYVQMSIKYPKAACLGISFLNDRSLICEKLSELQLWSAQHKHHFLGLYDLTEISTWPIQVNSVDTIKPFKAAYHGYELDECPRGLGKWNTQMKLSEPRQELLMFKNLARMHKALS